MDNKLDCEIIRDLLPSYVDGLTSSKTNKAVEEHLEDCKECEEILRCMKEPEVKKQEEHVEVDYLKKVRHHTKCAILICTICFTLAPMLLILIRYFYVGNLAQPQDVNYHITVSNRTVYFGGSLLSSANGISRVSFTEEEGIVRVKVYTTPIALFHSGEFQKHYTASEEIEEIRFGDLIIWEDGVAIGRTASQLYQATNPYIGDMPSNGRIATILGVQDQFGSYKNELQTKEEPYGWKLQLETLIESEEEMTAQDIMTADSYVMIATIGNLSYVTWQYSTETGPKEYTVTALDASNFVGADIKQSAKSASSLQTLLQSLSMKWSGVREVLQEDGKFDIVINNYSDEKIKEIQMNYYLNDKMVGSSSCTNANSSSFKKEESIFFRFMPEDFPAGTSAIELSGFSFDLTVIDQKGTEAIVCKKRKVSAKYAWTFFYTLTGNTKNGFTLTEG